MKFKEYQGLIIVLLVALLIRLFSLKNIFVADEAFFYSEPLTNIFSLHPPVFFLLQKLFIVPDIFWTARLVPLFFGIVNIALVYLLTKELFDKKTALYSSVIMAVSFWCVVASSMLDINGNVVMFEYLLAFTLLYRHFKSNKTSQLITLGIITGIAALTKYADALILIALLSFTYLYEKRNFAKAVKFGAIISVFSLVIFSLLPLLSAILGYWPQYLSTIKNTSVGNQWFTLRPIMVLLLWATPFLCGPALLSLLKPTKKKNYLLIWLAGVFVLYFVILRANRLTYERYLMTMIPPLCILCGSYLVDYTFKRKQIITGIITFIISYVIILYLNIKQNVFIPHMPAAYLNAVKTFHFNFFFPYVGSSGPAFWMSFESIIFALVVSTLFFVLFFAYRNKKGAPTLLVLFLAVSFAFNAFLVQEHSSLINPDVSKVSYEVIDYYNSHPLSKNVFIAGYMNSISVYLNNANNTKLNTRATERSLPKLINASEATILIVDFPTIDKSGELWKEVNKCNKVFTASDKGIELGWVYTCKRTTSQQAGSS